MLQIKEVSPAYSFQGHADLLIEGTENGVEKSWYYDNVDGTIESETGPVNDPLLLQTLWQATRLYRLRAS